jgi:hypothetical protein
MNKNLMFAAVVGLMSALSIASFGQDPRVVAAAGDKYVISAKAGGVNFVSGKVSVFRRNGTSGFLLPGDEIEPGDRVSTGQGSMAEILLNPGSYMRLGPLSSFEFGTTSLDDLRVSLRTGSAVFEVIAADDFRVSVQLPRSEIELTRSGVFRIDVLADGSGRIAVHKGKAFVGSGAETEVRAGRLATISRGGTSVTKFDRDEGDELDRWSKARAKELTRINAQLKRDALRNTLLSAYNGRGWNMYNSFGLWVFDPFRRMWCFLPFGSGWGSPYGWGYDFDIWRCRLPWWVYRDWYPTNTPTGGGGGGGGTTPPVVSPNEQRRARMQTPPFQRVEQSERSERGSTIIRRSDPGPIDSSPSGSGPVYSPPINPSPPTSTRSESGGKGKPDN